MEKEQIQPHELLPNIETIYEDVLTWPEDKCLGRGLASALGERCPLLTVCVCVCRHLAKIMYIDPPCLVLYNMPIIWLYMPFGPS